MFSFTNCEVLSMDILGSDDTLNTEKYIRRTLQFYKFNVVNGRWGGFSDEHVYFCQFDFSGPLQEGKLCISTAVFLFSVSANWSL